MRLPFLRKATTGDEPLIVAMTGIRLGESVIFAGKSPAWAVPLAARVGLSGRCVVIGPAETTGAIEMAASREGVLVEAADTVPSERTFDLAVVEAIGSWESAARDLRSSTRPGGRVVVVAGAPPTSLLGRLAGGTPQVVSSQSIVSTLSQLGWERVRPIGEREGVAFVEGFAA
jgi:hypothetical protein